MKSPFLNFWYLSNVNRLLYFRDVYSMSCLTNQKPKSNMMIRSLVGTYNPHDEPNQKMLELLVLLFDWGKNFVSRNNVTFIIKRFYMFTHKI